MLPWSDVQYPMYMVLNVFRKRPIRYQFPQWNRPYRVQYEIFYAKHEFFDTMEELQSVGAIDRTRYSRTLTKCYLGCVKVHLVMFGPERQELGSIFTKVHDQWAGWTEIAVDQSSKLEQKDYDCWWYIVDFVEDFAKRLNQIAATEAAKAAQQPPGSSSTQQALPGGAHQTESHAEPKQRVAQLSTLDKLERLRALRRAHIKRNRVGISFTAACQQVPITPKTAKDHALELRQRWDDPSYLE